jgi:hypothetical protein
MKNKIRGSFKSLFFYASIIIPLDQSSWEHIQFGKIKTNQVSFPKNQISIQVSKSSSFLIHPLKKEAIVSEILITGVTTGIIEKSFEDSVLKLGLVVPGTKRLSGPSSWFAKKWIKEVYKLAHKKKGLDHLEMFVATNDKESIGYKRIHPKSDFFIENFVFEIIKNKEFSLTYKLKTPIQTMALWLSADGDDTQSEFQTIIKSIELK